MLFASSPFEHFGLTVLEAMAAGLPVVAAAAAGHVEMLHGSRRACAVPARTTSRVRPRDCARWPPTREAAPRWAWPEHARQVEEFSLRAAGRRHRSRVPPGDPHEGARPMTDLVVASLERWDAVWRRNQHLLDGLLRADPRPARPVRRARRGPAARPERPAAPADGDGALGRRVTRVACGRFARSSSCRGASTRAPTAGLRTRSSRRHVVSDSRIRCSGSTTRALPDSSR